MRYAKLASVCLLHCATDIMHASLQRASIGLGNCMIIDTHVHIFSYPSFRDLSKYIRTMEDAIAFRTRYPDLYNCNLTEAADRLRPTSWSPTWTRTASTSRWCRRAPDMSRTIIVAQAAKRHPTRMVALARVGHDQEAAGYHDDPGPTREKAPAELERALTTLGMQRRRRDFRALADRSREPGEDRQGSLRHHARGREAQGADPVSDRLVAVSRRAVLRRSGVGRRSRGAPSDGAGDPDQDGAQHRRATSIP